MTVKTSKGAVNPKSPLNVVLGVLLLAVVAGAAWYVYSKNNTVASKPSASTSPAATAKAHTADEAVKAVTAFYNGYLPLKAQTVAKVGDNPNLEPAAVQVARASQDSLDAKFYNSILADYMSEYQSTGKVTKEEIACVNNTKSLGTVALASKTSDTAVVNVNLNLSDGTTKLVPVTVDLQSLAITNVSCIQ